MKGEIFCELTALGVDFSLLFLIIRSKQLCSSLDSCYQFFISGLFGIVTINVAEEYSKTIDHFLIFNHLCICLPLTFRQKKVVVLN